MKKIINGKTYNTETAKEIGNFSRNHGDFSFIEETLFRTQKGAYFIVGRGGPMSKYARSCGLNSWSGGDDLVPISEQDARSWMEAHGTADEYEAAFGVVEEA